MEEKKDKRMFLGFTRGREEDAIRKLPDSLISQILSYLTPKEAVRTSVLSNSWKSLWLLIPGLDLDSSEFSDYNAFASFMDRCLDFFREEKSCFHKLTLSIHHKDDNDDHDQSCLTHWIDFVATRKLKHLDVECFVNRKYLEVIPLSLFICDTLVYLRLRQVLFGSSSFEDSSSVSLPRLKTMHLEINIYTNERSLELLISSCSVLEDLSIVRRFDDNVKVLRVRSQTLTSLNIKYHLERVESFDCGQFGVLIDAPRLEYLNFVDELSPSKTITNSGSLTQVNLLGHLHLKGINGIHKFFTSFLGVRDLKISAFTFSHFRYMVSIPQFHNMSCLEANISSKYLLMHMPLCLLSSLEFVEIKSCVEGTVELARYFAEKSVIIKKIVLRLRSSILEENSAVLRDLLALPRRSSMCEFVVC